jgi:hypothetical protein
MNRRSMLAKSLLAATLVAATFSPVGPASATAIPDPNTQYRMDTYHYGSIRGEVIGQYAYPGPCGDAYWWGQTSQYVTTSWVTCPGN